MRREQAIASDGMWAGLTYTEPGMVSGWHHHREGNPTDHVATLVVVRAGRGVPTVNVDGPEPAPAASS
jgi:gentisate 1,2-dioxygenase